MYQVRPRNIKQPKVPRVMPKGRSSIHATSIEVVKGASDHKSRSSVRRPTAYVNPDRRATSPTNKGRERTTYCKYWLKSERCPKGNTCTWAHGESDMLPAQRVLKWNFKMKYKSETCDSTIKSEICKFGINCWFKHPEDKIGGTCKRFDHFGECYVSDAACPYRHVRPHVRPRNLNVWRPRI